MKQYNKLKGEQRMQTEITPNIIDSQACAIQEDSYVNESLHRIESLAKENLLTTADVMNRLNKKLTDLFGAEPDPTGVTNKAVDPEGWSTRTLNTMQDTKELLVDIHNLLDRL